LRLSLFVISGFCIPAWAKAKPGADRSNKIGAFWKRRFAAFIPRIDRGSHCILG